MKLLHIDSSILGPNSVSRGLTAALVARQKALHPGLEVIYLDLAASRTDASLPGAYRRHVRHQCRDRPGGDRRYRGGRRRSSTSFSQPTSSSSARRCIISRSPSQLKAWIDRVVVAGKTFQLRREGVPVGLVPQGKKVFIASSRGGAYHGAARRPRSTIRKPISRRCWASSA